MSLLRGVPVNVIVPSGVIKVSMLLVHTGPGED